MLQDNVTRQELKCWISDQDSVNWNMKHDIQDK